MSQAQDERLNALEQQLTQLIERVTELEQCSTDPQAFDPRVNIGVDEIDFALLDRLYSRQDTPFADDGVKGSLAYGVAYRSKNDKLTRWYIEKPAPVVLSYSEEPLAQVLIALGHSVRLQLVRLLLKEGPSDRQQIQTALDIKSPGQLYFHLNSLLAAGIVVQLRRGVYEIEFGKIANVLVVLGAAIELANGIPEDSEISE